MKSLPLFILVLIFSLPSFASFKLATYNIRNFDYDSRSHVSTNKPHLVKTLSEVNADLFAVQEINKTEVFDSMIQKNFKGRYKTIFTDCGGAHDQKLGFVFNPSLFKLITFKQDLRTVNLGQDVNQRNFNCRNGSRPLAVAQFKELETGRNIIVITVHLKSGGQTKSIKKRFKQLQIIKRVITEHRNIGFEHFIVLGDFNSTQYSDSNSSGHSRFENIVNEMKLDDTAADLKCTSYWWGGFNDATQYPSALDHILISNSLSENSSRPKAKAYGHCAKLSCGITGEADMGVSFDQVSDHCPIAVEL